MINRLPAEELLASVRATQAEWRAEVQRGGQRMREPKRREWWVRLPELIDDSSLTEPGRRLVPEG